MPHCKNTQTIREIAKSFEKNTEKAMNDIANTIKALKVDDRSIGVKSKANSRLKLSDKLAIMLLFPFFSIANISHYVGSKLSALCQPGCKDMFYEMQKSPVIDWRSLLSVIMEIADYFDTDTDTIFEKCINDNEKFNKFINIAAFRESLNYSRNLNF